MSKLLRSMKRQPSVDLTGTGSESERMLSFNELLVKNEWVPSSERDRCAVCSQRFNTFRRKGHCRMCGEVLCGNCTVKKDALLPILGVSKVKICKPCFVSVNQEGNTGGRPSDMSMTIGSGDDMDVSQKDMDDLESLISPTSAAPDRLSFTGWDTTGLNVRWLPADEIVDLKELRHDVNSNIWSVRYQGTTLAALRLQKAKRTQEAATDFVNGIALASRLQHPRVVEFVGASWTADHDLQMLFEQLPHSLRTYLNTTAVEAVMNPRRQIEKLRIALDIAEGLAYMHSLEEPLHHRALESKTVFLTTDNRAKIGKFSGVRIESVVCSGSGCSEVARWLAPEIISGSGAYGSACDIYSLGIILSELDTHLVPFSDCLGPQGNLLPTVAVLFLISLGQAKPTLSPRCPAEIRQLVEDCVAFEPQDRPTAIEVVARLRAVIRSFGLETELETGKTPQHNQGIVLWDDSL